ncbi:MAG: heme-dependent oxidative N-demethylase family protein, partial [Cognatishimia activa]
DSVARPDGRAVALNYKDPLGTLAQLVQEDFCILQKQGNEHVLTGALLCFPASWTLAEKFMRPLVRIHKPVRSYDANIAKRVQRLFDGVRVGRPVWRFNALHYADAELFHPRTEDAPREDDHREQSFLRSERQVIMRLPETDAVVFAIHTYVVEA